MLKYYSYYSIGGYKDLYLGTSEMMEPFTYYLPLLAIQKKNAESEADSNLLAKISELDKLPKIKLVNKTNSFGLPNFGAKLISHGGYKLIFTHAEDNTYILTLRDINGENKDESGRPIPFLIMIVADNLSDANKLAGIAAYWSNYLDTITSKLSSMFIYDHIVNGVKFNLKEFNLLLEQCANTQTEIETCYGRNTVNVKENTVGALLILPGITDTLLIEELNIQDKTINMIYTSEILPKDNPKKSKMMLLQVQKKKVAQRKKKILYYTIGGIISIGLIAYLILISTSHHK